MRPKRRDTGQTSTPEQRCTSWRALNRWPHVIYEAASCYRLALPRCNRPVLVTARLELSTRPTSGPHPHRMCPWRSHSAFSCRNPRPLPNATHISLPSLTPTTTPTHTRTRDTQDTQDTKTPPRHSLRHWLWPHTHDHTRAHRTRRPLTRDRYTACGAPPLILSESTDVDSLFGASVGVRRTSVRDERANSVSDKSSRQQNVHKLH